MSLQGKVYVLVAMTLISLASIFVIPAGYVLLQGIANGDERITNLSDNAYQYIGSRLIPLVDSTEKSIFEASDVFQGIDPIKINQQSLLVSLILICLAFSALVLGVLQKSTLRRLSKLVEQLSNIGRVGKLTERVDVKAKMSWRA